MPVYFAALLVKPSSHIPRALSARSLRAAKREAAELLTPKDPDELHTLVHRGESLVVSEARGSGYLPLATKRIGASRWVSVPPDFVMVRSEAAPTYIPGPTESDNEIIVRALQILERQINRAAPVMDSPTKVREYLCLLAAREEREVFTIMFLDSQHRVIATEAMFSGTLTQTSVYPREVVKRALQLNAGAVILSHNHPSGMSEPSRADEHLTQALKSALALVDVRVLDHIVVAAGRSVSFAERGLL